MSSPPAPSEPALQGAARLLAEGRPAAAAERLAGIVAETPTYAAAHVLRATALEAAGFVDEALVSWGRAAALVPRSPLVHRERSRLLATRLADAPADALPPPEPDPAAARAPEPEAPLDDDGADGPLLDFGAPAALEASDLLFTSAPPAEAPPAAPEPPAGEPPAPPPTAPLAPIPADWGPDETDHAPVLPPTGPDDRADAPPPAPDADDDPGAPAPDAPDDSDRMGPLGWDLVGEEDVPTPPPGTTVDPDVVAPEGPLGPPPAAPEGPQDARSVADELDDLIAQLEDAPRIRPDPAFSGPEVPLDAGDVDDMASETLAKIYAAQQQYVEAAIMYEKLAARQPADAERLLERAAALRQQAG